MQTDGIQQGTSEELLEQEALWLWYELAAQRAITEQQERQLAEAKEIIRKLEQQLAACDLPEPQSAPQTLPEPVSPPPVAPCPDALLELLQDARQTAAQLKEYPGYSGLLFELAGETANLNELARGEPQLAGFYKLSSLLEAFVAELWKNTELMSEEAMESIQGALDQMERSARHPQEQRRRKLAVVAENGALSEQLRSAIALLDVDAHQYPEVQHASAGSPDLILGTQPSLSEHSGFQIPQTRTAIELALRIQTKLAHS